MCVRTCVCLYACVYVCSVLVCVSLSGILIYFGYGMWNSTLEIRSREQEVHASTYQRYDGHHAGVDDGFSGFSVDDDLYPPSNNDPWAAPDGVDGSGLVPPKADDDDWMVPKGGAKRALAEEDPVDF